MICFVVIQVDYSGYLFADGYTVDSLTKLFRLAVNNCVYRFILVWIDIFHLLNSTQPLFIWWHYFIIAKLKDIIRHLISEWGCKCKEMPVNNIHSSVLLLYSHSNIKLFTDKIRPFYSSYHFWNITMIAFFCFLKILFAVSP